MKNKSLSSFIFKMSSTCALSLRSSFVNVQVELVEHAVLEVVSSQKSSLPSLYLRNTQKALLSSSMALAFHDPAPSFLIAILASRS